MTFKAEITGMLGWKWDAGAVDDSRLEYARQLLDGYETSQAEAVWHSENRTLADGASETFDLTALTRTVLGNTITTTFDRIKAVVIVNLTTGGELLVGDALVNEWASPFGRADDRVKVPADSVLVLSNRRDGWAVGAGAHDSSSSSSSSGEESQNKNLKIEADGSEVSYSIAIVGTTTVPPEASSSSSGA